jgi:hypothetical protein
MDFFKIEYIESEDKETLTFRYKIKEYIKVKKWTRQNSDFNWILNNYELIWDNSKWKTPELNYTQKQMYNNIKELLHQYINLYIINN